jgi:hypothetical protein
MIKTYFVVTCIARPSSPLFSGGRGMMYNATGGPAAYSRSASVPCGSSGVPGDVMDGELTEGQARDAILDSIADGVFTVDE